jgi:hypothetical protein
MGFQRGRGFNTPINSPSLPPPTWAGIFEREKFEARLLKSN